MYVNDIRLITLNVTRWIVMPQITARIPDELSHALDKAAHELNRNRAEVIRQALGYYLEDYEDLARALEHLKDPADPVLEWDAVRRDLLDQD